MTQDNLNTPNETRLLSREIVLAHQQQSFHALLRHVWQSSSFYRDLYSASGIGQAELAEVTPSDLPIINKKLLMENFAGAVTDLRLKKNDLERWLHENRNPAANYCDDFIVVHSSGSSGNPAIFVCSRADWQMAASAMAGRLPPPANYPAGKTRVAFHLATHGNFGGVAVAARLSRRIYETLILSVHDSHQEVARKLNDFQPHQLHGYASGVHDLSLLAMTGELRISPKRIVVGGDKLTASVERDIRRVWNVPVYDFYSASESNYIALRRCGDDEMTVIEDLNILEVLDDADRPVPENQEGRVVVTNLYNRTLPIIRYELGDYVSLGKENPGQLYATIKDIRGRAIDALPITLHDGRKDRLNSHVLSAIYVPALEKFQYISQRADYFEILYVSAENLDAVIRTQFQRILDLKSAAKTTFQVRRVARIASDPHTGKYNLVKIHHQPRTDSLGVIGELNRFRESAADERTLTGAFGEPGESMARQCPDELSRNTDSHATQSETVEPNRVPVKAQSSIDAEARRLARSESRRGQGEYRTSRLNRRLTNLPPEQQVIQAKSFHPSGTFVEFMKEEIERSIPERFEKIVSLHCHRIAVKTADRAVTYAELNAIANRLAREILAGAGTTQEPVALLFDNGAALFAAMLGVLKAGRFFVAVDPSLPKARIAVLLEDSQATLVVTDGQYLALAGQVASTRCRLLDLESIDQSIPATNLGLPVSADALALIFYTSGSSGAAKALLWSHRVLLHHLMLTTNAFHGCAEDRISLLASGTSGAVTNGLFALLIGAALLPFDVRKEGIARLPSWLSEERISICWFSPQLFRNLRDALRGREQFTDLRLIRLAGEAVYRSDIDLYKQHFPGNCLLVNALSSSEAGFLSICYVDHNCDISGNEVPVGYPVADKQIFLLDEEGNDVGFNQVGEIVVRSRYLSLGYWRRPDLTDAKFRADGPGDRDERLYFTGDLGLMRPDGCLIYKGRKDFRVKIRGYGVEFAEVEKVLLEHTGIREAVVAAPENESGEARLVAYVTCTSQPSPSVTELRGFAKQNLPDYMIPSAFVILDEMPLTPNGKVDRRALPDLDHARPQLNTPFVSPGTSIEKQLADIWAEALDLAEVGIHDNFFDLGGHSLAAFQVISRVNNRFQLELPAHSLFRSQTVAEMALLITQSQAHTLNQEDLDRILTDLESVSDLQAQACVARENAENVGVKGK